MEKGDDTHRAPPKAREVKSRTEAIKQHVHTHKGIGGHGLQCKQCGRQHVQKGGPGVGVGQQDIDGESRTYASKTPANKGF